MLIHRLKTAGTYWVEDDASQLGAALAYFTLFSMAPLLILVLAMLGQVSGDERAKQDLVEQIRGFTDADTAVAVRTMLDNYKRPPLTLGPALVGTITMIFGALGLFTQLRSSLHRVWRLQAPPTQGVIYRLVKNYLLAFVMVLVTSIFILLMLSASTVVSLLIQWWGAKLPGDGFPWWLGDFFLSCFLITPLFAFTFRFMSDGRIRYRHLWEGAAIGAILFTVGKILIGFYLAQSHLGSSYGVAGSLVVFLVWVYYSGQIFFFGAEMVRVRLKPSVT